MKLTGKCKEEFIFWMCENYPEIRRHEYETMPECAINSLIIEFFDSVGIYIEVNYNVTVSKSFWCNSVSDSIFNSRIEATNEAITKANIIYNETQTPRLITYL